MLEMDFDRCRWKRPPAPAFPSKKPRKSRLSRRLMFDAAPPPGRVRFLLASDGAAAFRAVFLPVATGCKGLSTPFAGPCTLPVNIGAEYLVGGQNRPPEVLAQQRIGNRLHAHAALAIVQRQTVATVVVGAQPPDQPVAACPLGGRQALDLIQLSSPPSPSHS